MKIKFLMILIISVSFSVTIAQNFNCVNNNSKVSNSYGAFTNLSANNISNLNLNNTLVTSINNLNETNNLSLQSSFNNLKFGLKNNMIFEKEISYANDNFTNFDLKIGPRKKGKGRLIAGIIVGSIGLVQVVAGIGLLASSPMERTASAPGQVSYTPTTANGVIGTVLIINGAAMTSIGVKLMIPKKSKKGYGSRRRR
jgi:hypothetical protein